MKILILADSLGIGGAETHIEALARGLCNLGCNVTVASSGGKIAKRLQKCGIKHLFLPNRERALSVFFAICRIIERERPDIVHAHTRRTALLATAPCKKRKIPLAVSAHARFSMDFPKNLISAWGDVTIAVSEDIRAHVIKSCSLAPERIKTVQNGVELPKYCTRRGFENRKIAFVSRLDKDSSLGAHVLCEIAPRLAKKYPEIEIVIVGGGAEYRKIAAKCSEINKKHNRRLINAVGTVENVSEILKEASLFVGVSRAALESMARGVPTILLGNEGYLGLLDRNNLSLAERTNFTCRGHECDKNTIPHALFNEICAFFELSECEKAEISDFCRHVVEQNYTVEKMTLRTLDAYTDLLKSRRGSKNLLLCGYYGQGNLGDEMILEALLKILSEVRGVRVKILKSKNLFSVLRDMAWADIFVFGGGSLLQNATSDASLLYYLFLLRLSHIFCARNVMLANGIGPIGDGIISRSSFECLIGGSLESFDALSVRDGGSFSFVKRLLPHKDITLVPDPALLLIEKNINRRLGNPENIVFIPCSAELKRWGIGSTTVADSLRCVEKELGAKVCIAALNEKEDSELASAVSKRLGGRKITILRRAADLEAAVSSARVCVCQRYHGALFSVALGVPTFCVSSDPKLISLCDDFGLAPACHPTVFSDVRGLKKALATALLHNCNTKSRFEKAEDGIEEQILRCIFG